MMLNIFDRDTFIANEKKNRMFTLEKIQKRNVVNQGMTNNISEVIYVFEVIFQ